MVEAGPEDIRTHFSSFFNRPSPLATFDPSIL